MDIDFTFLGDVLSSILLGVSLAFVIAFCTHKALKEAEDARTRNAPTVYFLKNGGRYEC